MNKTKAAKVVVYAIAKNEERFAARWIRSMSEADEVVVLDTGSTDGTVDMLRRAGARVESAEVSPWRFDAARNLSLGLIPPDADLCVTTDLDEYFTEGWAERLRVAAAENPDATIFDFAYQDVNGEGEAVAGEEKFPAHRKGIVRWVYRVHEEMRYSCANTAGFVDGVTLIHDPDKGKPRGYIELLEQGMAEKPNAHDASYLALAYWSAGRPKDALRMTRALLGGLRVEGDRLPPRTGTVANMIRRFADAFPCESAMRLLERSLASDFRYSTLPFVALALRAGLWQEADALARATEGGDMVRIAGAIAGMCGFPCYAREFQCLWRVASCDKVPRTDFGGSAAEKAKERNRLENETGIVLRYNH